MKLERFDCDINQENNDQIRELICRVHVHGNHQHKNILFPIFHPIQYY